MNYGPALYTLVYVVLPFLLALLLSSPIPTQIENLAELDFQRSTVSLRAARDLSTLLSILTQFQCDNLTGIIRVLVLKIRCLLGTY